MTIHELQRGQRMPLGQVSAGTHFILRAYLPGMGGADLSVFGLDEQRQLSDDRYFIFYNQKSSPEGAIEQHPDNSFTIDLERTPLQIHRLLFTATSDAGSFSGLGQNGAVLFEDSGHDGVRFALEGSMFGAEQAVMLLELYRHQGQWRVMAVGQGFNGGLQALLESLGGQAVEEAPASAPPPAAPVVETPPTVPPIHDWPQLQSAPLAPQSKNQCRRCGQSASLLNRLDSGGICGKCAREIKEGLRRFRTRFVSACTDGLMEYHEWIDLQQTIYHERLNANWALEFVRPDALRLLERTFTLARSDGEIAEAEENFFNWLVFRLEIPNSMVEHLRRELVELKEAGRIRAGHLPTIQSSIILEAGEVAHLECSAAFRHVTASKVRDIPGKLIVTNRQIHFVSPTEGGWNIQYGKVLQIEEMSDGVNLLLGVKKGSGYYRQVEQPVLLGATLDALVRINKRLLLMPQTEKASRNIPQKVKLEVWQRDGGKCVECGDTNYLEFDHVIPHSLGGASTVGNLQLLCRRCNLQKSNRI